MDNDSLNSRIELNSKEVIVKSCQMFKARFVHGRIKKTVVGVAEGWNLNVLVWEFENIPENVFVYLQGRGKIKCTEASLFTTEEHVPHIIPE